MDDAGQTKSHRAALTGAIVIAVTLLLTAIPAHAQEAFMAFGCHLRAHAEALAGEMTEQNVQNADPRWATCKVIAKPIGRIHGAPKPLMVLEDWEGDTFALYEDVGAFFIVYWLNGYQPTGAGI